MYLPTPPSWPEIVTKSKVSGFYAFKCSSVFGAGSRLI